MSYDVTALQKSLNQLELDSELVLGMHYHNLRSDIELVEFLIAGAVQVVFGSGRRIVARKKKGFNGWLGRLKSAQGSGIFFYAELANDQHQGFRGRALGNCPNKGMPRSDECCHGSRAAQVPGLRIAGGDGMNGAQPCGGQLLFPAA
jgi:hypothetical protein